MMSKCMALCNFKLKLSGASIALRFNGPKRMKSYKNEKSNILTANYKQIKLILFYIHVIILNSFKNSQMYTPYFIKKHLNNC